MPIALTDLVVCPHSSYVLQVSSKRMHLDMWPPGGGGRARSLYATPPSPPPPRVLKIVVPGRPPTSVFRENCPAPKAPIFFFILIFLSKKFRKTRIFI